MPLYEFDCQDCHDRQEILVRSPGEKIICPSCGSSKLERLLSMISAPVIQGSTGSSCRTELPVAGGCGKPQCGTGGCMFGNS